MSPALGLRGNVVIDSTRNHLQDHIDAASPGDLIKIHGDCQVDSSYDAEPVLLIDKRITLQGGWNNDFSARNVNQRSIIDASDEGQVIEVNADDVTLDTLTIRDGNTSANGAGVYNRGDNLRIRNSSIISNTTTGDGGGIYNTGDLRLVRSDIDGNRADSTNLGNDGAGIYSAGANSKLTVVNSRIRGNELSVAVSGTDGGGIYSTSETLILNSSITGNTATDGPGIYIDDTDASIINSTVSGNNGFANSGAIEVRGGTTTVQNSIVYNNTDNDLLGFGGTVNITHSLYDSEAGSVNDMGDNLVVPTSEVNRVLSIPRDPNEAPTTDGSYILASQSLALDMGDLSLLPSESDIGIDVNGDGIFDRQTIPIDLGGAERLIGPDVDAGAYEGGAPLNYCYVNYTGATGNVTLSAANINPQRNVLQEAINAANFGSTLKLAGRCIARYDFAAANMMTMDKSLTLEGGYNFVDGTPDFDAPPSLNNRITIDANSNNRSIPGRILTVNEGASSTIENVTMINGNAQNLTPSGGGAILNTGVFTVLNIRNSRLESNIAEDGGGIENDSTLFIYDSELANNEASNFGGGLENNAVAVLVGVTINRNSGVNYGGGIDNNAGDLLVINSEIRGNESPNGGGIAQFNGDTTIVNTLFSGNLATNNGGAIDYGGGDATTSSLHIVNSTISGNYASNNGGGIYTSAAGDTTAENSVLYNNAANEGLGDDLRVTSSTNPARLESSAYGDTSGLVSSSNALPLSAGQAANLFIEPLDPSSIENGFDGDFRLKPGSALLNAGDDTLLPDESTLGINNTPLDIDGDGIDDPIDVDIEGNTRQVNGPVDMGAYEYQGPFCFVQDGDGTIHEANSITNSDNPLEDAQDAVSGGLLKIAGDCVAGASFTGVHLLLIRKNIQLQGGYPVVDGVPNFDAAPNPSANPTILDANMANRSGFGRILTINFLGGIEIRGLILQGGDVSSVNTINGGAISNGGFTLLRDVVVRDNTSAASGGGIYNGQTLTIADSTITGNTGDNGGGIYNDELLTVVNSVVNGNTSTATGAGGSATGGGGIYNNNTLYVGNSLISGNRSADDAGGIYSATDAETTLVSSTFAANDAPNGFGGGVLNVNGTVTIINSILSTNEDINKSNIYTSAAQNEVAITNYGHSLGANGGASATAPGRYELNNLGGNTSNPYPDTFFADHISANTAPNTGGDFSLVASLSREDFFAPTSVDLDAPAQFVTRGLPINSGDDASVIRESDINFDYDGNGHIEDDILPDLAGNPRQVGTIDMGAYEYQGASFDSFDASPGHVQNGQTTITFDLVAFGTDAVITVHYSPDENCTMDDPQLGDPLTYPANNGTSTQTETVSLPRDLLYAQALASDPASQGTGTQSQDIGYVCVFGYDDLVDLDDGNALDSVMAISGPETITYFPFDADSDGAVTPLDANNFIRELGSTNTTYDMDGNGVVTPSEVVNVLLRLGYLRNDQFNE